MECKLDSYYLSSVAEKAFTETEFCRYTRDRDKEGSLYYEALRKAETTRRKAVLHSTVHGGADSVEKKLAEAEKADKASNMARMGPNDH